MMIDMLMVMIPVMMLMELTSAALAFRLQVRERVQDRHKVLRWQTDRPRELHEFPAIVLSDQIFAPADLVDDGGLHGFLVGTGLWGFVGRVRNALFACEQADAQHAHGHRIGPSAAAPLYIGNVLNYQ